MRKQQAKRGFTLVEILIVVAIIGALVAIAIPILVRARISANESTAKKAMRTISTALEMYRSDQSPPTFPPTMATLSADVPPYIDAIIAGGFKSGYEFNYYAAPATVITVAGVTTNLYADFSLSVTPQSSGDTGNITLYTNSSGVLYADETAPFADPGTVYTAQPPADFDAISR